jgi:hypothetical protein
MDITMTPDGMLKTASAIATRHGKNAAGWVFDGNTPRERYAAMLKGIQDGDPKIMDSVNEPRLGDGGYTTQVLLDDTGWTPAAGLEIAGQIGETYGMDITTAFWHEIERTCRYHLGLGLASCGHPANEDSECDCPHWPEPAPHPELA